MHSIAVSVGPRIFHKIKVLSEYNVFLGLILTAIGCAVNIFNNPVK